MVRPCSTRMPGADVECTYLKGLFLKKDGTVTPVVHDVDPA